MEYDKNYLELVRSLYRYGKLLYDKQLTDEALSILKYALSIKTDISANYTLLATIYKEKNDAEGINSVISAAEELTSMTKKALLANLVAIRDSAVSQ
jgi:tetratricopeptide (TPR) repeat protein